MPDYENGSHLAYLDRNDTILQQIWTKVRYFIGGSSGLQIQSKSILESLSESLFVPRLW